MAYVILDANNNIISMCGVAQNPPTPAGYAVIDDADPRIAPWIAAQQIIFNPPQSYTFLQFIKLFSPTEQAALVNSTDTQVKLFNLMAAGVGSIQLNNPEVVQGINYVASLGIIANSRIAEILAGQVPS